MKCPASLVEPQIKLAEKEAADSTIGTLAHAALARYFASEAPPDVDKIMAQVEKPDVDMGEIKRLFLNGIHVVRIFLNDGMKIEAVEPDIKRGYGDITLTGHADMLASRGEECIILDYKSGRVERDYRPQLLGYALIAGILGGVKTIAVNLSERTWEIENFTKDEIINFEEKFLALPEKKDLYQLNEFCEFCPRLDECPLQRSAQVQAMEIFGKTLDVEKADVAQLASLYPQYELVRDACEKYHSILKQMVSQFGGRVQLEDGSVLEIQSSKAKKIIPNAEAIKSIFDTLFGMAAPNVHDIDSTIETIAECLSISKSPLEKKITALAPPRQGKKWIGVLYEKLEARGCMREFEILRLNHTGKKKGELTSGKQQTAIESKSTGE
jgi:hypothetical protein